MRIVNRDQVSRQIKKAEQKIARDKDITRYVNNLKQQRDYAYVVIALFVVCIVIIGTA